MNRLPATLLLALACALASAAPAAAQGSGQQLTPRLQGMALDGGAAPGRLHRLPPPHGDREVHARPEPVRHRRLLDPAEPVGRRAGARPSGSASRSRSSASRWARCSRAPTAAAWRRGSWPSGGPSLRRCCGWATRGRAAGRDDPGIAIRKLLDTPPEAGKNNVLIAHSVTLLYAFGLTSRPEGIAHVFRPSGLGLGQPELRRNGEAGRMARLRGPRRGCRQRRGRGSRIARTVTRAWRSANYVESLSALFGRIGAWSFDHRWVVLAALPAVLLGASVFLASRARFDNSFEAYFDTDDPTYADLPGVPRRTSAPTRSPTSSTRRPDRPHGPFDLEVMRKIQTPHRGPRGGGPLRRTR